MPWLQVGVQGAEYGALRWKDGEQAPKLGDRLEIYCTNLDQSTNAFDAIMWPRVTRSSMCGPSWDEVAQLSASEHEVKPDMCHHHVEIAMDTCCLNIFD